MILQSLASYYEVLAKDGKVPRDGWAKTSVQYQIRLNPDGTIEEIVDLRPDMKNQKPRIMELPSLGTSSGSGVRANFLFGSAAYILGLPEGESAKDKRTAQCVEDAWRLHHAVLADVKTPETEALLLYFDRLKENKHIDAKYISDLPPTALTQGNYIFKFGGQLIHEVSEVRAAWDRYYQQQGENCVQARCLVTGEIAPIAQLHPLITGLPGANGKGAGLANFNIKSCRSYGYEQNLNAPVSRHAAYAYTQVLSYLLTNQNYSYSLGDNFTIVWWPGVADEDYGALVKESMIGTDKSSKWTDVEIAQMLSVLSKGQPVNNIEPNCRFYVMGLTPNKTRIIVRFFWQNTFGALLKNVVAHYDRLDLIGCKDGRKLTAFRAFRAMVRDDGERLPEPVIRAYFESILFGHRYPEQMFTLTHRRIQVAGFQKKQDTGPGDSPMYWQRMSLIKAYYLQTLPDNDERKKCFAVKLLEDNATPGYVLGRLFAVYEAAQNVGLGKKPWVEAPIHSMFSNAMSSPATVYPMLACILSIYLPMKSCWKYQQLVGQIKLLLPGEYPKNLDLVDQGAFDLGYYHQREALFTKKDKGEDKVSTDSSEENEKGEG